MRGTLMNIAAKQHSLDFEPYTKITNSTLTDLYKESNTTFKIAIFFIQKLQNRKNPYWMATNYIQKSLSIRWDSINKAIARLQEIGLIQVFRSGNKTYYKLLHSDQEQDKQDCYTDPIKRENRSDLIPTDEDKKTNSNPIGNETNFQKDTCIQSKKYQENNSSPIGKNQVDQYPPDIQSIGTKQITQNGDSYLESCESKESNSNLIGNIQSQESHGDCSNPTGNNYIEPSQTDFQSIGMENESSDSIGMEEQTLSNEREGLSNERTKVFHLKDIQLHYTNNQKNNNKQTYPHGNYTPEIESIRIELSLLFFSASYFQELFQKSNLSIEGFKRQCEIIQQELSDRPKKNPPGYFTEAIVNHWVLYEAEKAIRRREQQKKKNIMDQQRKQQEEKERIKNDKITENIKNRIRQVPNFQILFETAKEKALKKNNFVYQRYLTNPDSKIVQVWINETAWKMLMDAYQNDAMSSVLDKVES